MRILPFLAAAAIFFLGFWLVYRRNKASIVAGAFFASFVLALLLAWFFGSAAASEHWLARLSFGAMFFALLFVLSFGAYFLVVLLLLNARVVLRREKRTLANSLTLLAACALVVLLAVASFMRGDRPLWLQTLWSGMICLGIFYCAHVLAFLTALTLFNLARPRGDKDYIIVLGCGLKGGAVSPLLAERVRRALVCARLQVRRGGKKPLLVMSGGQGPDESRSEAAAMKEFALAQGCCADYILTEDRSVNTEENMRFSKQIIEKQAGGGSQACMFVTSNYHLLRAAHYARQAGLGTEGAGAKTAWYYVPNAVMREYIAFLSLHKGKCIAVAAVAFALGLAFPRLPLHLARIFLI
ncbi:MAG: YdcF family protein [Gracilibacteraceae bacterium]|jgi:uncharacterized SAM-binding protein YcdF (DUF218 family)|nr:YdcF family protein [Gracilibacteraceae bacterium]